MHDLTAMQGVAERGKERCSRRPGSQGCRVGASSPRQVASALPVHSDAVLAAGDQAGGVVGQEAHRLDVVLARLPGQLPWPAQHGSAAPTTSTGRAAYCSPAGRQVPQGQLLAALGINTCCSQRSTIGRQVEAHDAAGMA